MLLLLLFSCPVMPDSATPWTAACQASLSLIISQSCPSSCPLHWWCHPAISSSDALFSFCPQSSPTSGVFPMSQLFTSDDQNTGASASELPYDPAIPLLGIYQENTIIWKDICTPIPCSSFGKESGCNAGDLGSIPELRRSPEEGNGNLLQYSCLGNPMDRGTRQTTALGVTRAGHDVGAQPSSTPMFIAALFTIAKT